MKAHQKLWEAATCETAEVRWVDADVTTHEEFEELNSDENFPPDDDSLPCTDIDHRMFALFAALMFGGELEV